MEVRRTLWPAMLFARISDLRATDQNFGDRIWRVGEIIPGVGVCTDEMAAIVGVGPDRIHLETFSGTTFELRAREKRIELVHHVRIADLAAAQHWLAADPPWFHITGSTTMPHVWGSLPPEQIPDYGPGGGQWVPRVAWWQRIVRRSDDPQRDNYLARFAAFRDRIGIDPDAVADVGQRLRRLGHMGGGVMNVLLCLSHSIEEYDQLRLLHGLGLGVASIGGYIDPANPHVDIRPALPDIPQVPEVRAAVDSLGTPDNLGAAQEHIPDAILDWLGDDGVIIYHHYLERLVGQWPRIRDWMQGKPERRVIWRTVGQSVAGNEAMMAPLRADGLERVAYSPKEANIPGYIGHDALIRFYKDPAEWHGWTGDRRARHQLHPAPPPARAVHQLDVLGGGHARRSTGSPWAPAPRSSADPARPTTTR